MLLNIALHGLEEAAGVRYLTGDRAGEVAGTSPALVGTPNNLVASFPTGSGPKGSRRGWPLAAPPGAALNQAQNPLVPPNKRGSEFLEFTLLQSKPANLLIKPGAPPIKGSRNRLPKNFRALRGANVAAVLARIPPIVRGWVPNTPPGFSPGCSTP